MYFVVANQRRELGVCDECFGKSEEEKGGGCQGRELACRNMLHLPEGQKRDARDRALAVDGLTTEGIERENFHLEKTSYGIGDRNIRDWCYGYDIRKEIAAAW
ncbi:hypothetical protein ONS95_007087 [Cadophora gregata]|uniref:uncharacterized protein n=1 Tax=Cadophora gregata TaxID=51156 RepID=UPI0026DBB4BE|nr:uncharacterized protein ONS95_007087 [Cadophora gregata]KAK0100632.1 hypothetical protein ONS95_007087 [Cadophora gregata]KAK0117368.1 hypothetical protein ONS96_013198 [Cadophora gregata f. sp. sojae]